MSLRPGWSDLANLFICWCGPGTEARVWCILAKLSTLSYVHSSVGCFLIVFIYLSERMCARMCARACACMCVCICVYVCACACVCVHMCIHACVHVSEDDLGSWFFFFPVWILGIALRLSGLGAGPLPAALSRCPTVGLFLEFWDETQGLNHQANILSMSTSSGYLFLLFVLRQGLPKLPRLALNPFCSTEGLEIGSFCLCLLQS